MAVSESNDEHRGQRPSQAVTCCRGDVRSECTVVAPGYPDQTGNAACDATCYDGRAGAALNRSRAGPPRWRRWARWVYLDEASRGLRPGGRHFEGGSRWRSGPSRRGSPRWRGARWRSSRSLAGRTYRHRREPNPRAQNPGDRGTLVAYRAVPRETHGGEETRATGHPYRGRSARAAGCSTGCIPPAIAGRRAGRGRRWRSQWPQGTRTGRTMRASTAMPTTRAKPS